MPLYADATAPKALGLLGIFPLLRHYASDVVIPKWVYRELRIVQNDVDAALAAGWLRHEDHSDTQVDRYMDNLNLDRGEAELLDILTVSKSSGNIVLIDEGLAYGILAGRAKGPPLVCLADVLTDLEVTGHVRSADALMRQALAAGYYAWAPKVRDGYVKRCNSSGVTVLPG